VDWADAKERVRQATDIVELIGQDRQLRREGRGYKTLCPWHDDSRPSLQINAERQSWKCWVCDIGGDVFSWVMKREGVDFGEALRMLADKAGIQLEARRGEGGGLSGDEKRDVLQVLAWAEQRFHAFLMQAPDAEPARKYLLERGITVDSMNLFRIGYSPNRWDWLVNEARSTSFPQKLLITAGLVRERQNGPGTYDWFRGRTLFSIHDPLGRTVGFGGRVLPGVSDDSPAKYVNSPETPVFTKSSLLYALDHAKDAIAHDGHAVVMEGYTDVIIAHQCGFKSAVAVLGTALGERHIRLLRRFTDRIILVLDGDEAGRKRTDEVLELFVAEQVDLRILTLPDELDPADFLLQHGADAFRTLLGQAVDALDHKFRSLVDRLGSNPSTHQINQAVEHVLAILAKAPGSVGKTDSGAKLREDQMLVRLAHLSGVAEDRLRQRLAALRRTAQTPAVPRPATNSPAAESRRDEPDEPKFERAERWFMELWLQSPALLPEIQSWFTAEFLRREAHRRIYSRACELQAGGILPDFDRLMLEFEDLQVKTLLVSLDEDRRARARPATSEELHELARVLSERNSGTQFGSPRVPNSVSTTPTAERDETDLLRSLVERERRRRGITSPTDGTE
jgi:DNA primase